MVVVTTMPNGMTARVAPRARFLTGGRLGSTVNGRIQDLGSTVTPKLVKRNVGTGAAVPSVALILASGK